jgi:arsenite methyltransferase
VGCIAGALSEAEYQEGLAETGFEQISVTFTHQVADGLHSAIIKATKPDGLTTSETRSAATTPAGRTTLPLADEPTTGCC